MKVAIDARALLPPATGIGTYTRGIAGALASRAGGEGRLFTPRPLPESEALGPWSVGADRHRSGMLWVQTTLPRRARDWGADVLLAALTIGPVRGGQPGHEGHALAWRGDPDRVAVVTPARCAGCCGPAAPRRWPMRGAGGPSTGRGATNFSGQR